MDRRAPGAPFLALGQTVFWDEPVKAGIALAAASGDKPRRFIAGVHDTDYFAKLPSSAKHDGGFKAVPHNDTGTKGLWSAAAEFSALFGSETVVTRDTLLAAGLRLGKLLRARPQILDEASEAWGWRGIVSLAEDPPIAAGVPMSALWPELKATLDWAIDLSLASVCEPQRMVSAERADHLRRLVAESYLANQDASLSDFYQALLAPLYRFASGRETQVETTKTTELLRFNKKTCGLPRFDLLNLFLSGDSAQAARDSYNEALRGSEIYGLERFGTGAIPFDLVIPGRGRGTLRIAPRAVVVMTKDPLFISLKQPVRHVQDLAQAITSKFGDNCALVGKAVTLIGMLAREHVFVFHEGASSYVKYTRKFHDLLHENGHGLKMNPILRVRLSIWDALEECATWIRLPEPFQRPFGTEELAGKSFAARWKDVGKEQEGLLRRLGALHRPLDLIEFLEQSAGGSWHCLAREYGGLHQRLESLAEQVNELKRERIQCYGELRSLKQARVDAERAMGAHFRHKIFEKSPAQTDWDQRKRLAAKVEEAVHQVLAKEREIKTLHAKQAGLVAEEGVRAVHERRRTIEQEAELKRLRLIRQAVITSRGLDKASHRPSAWWFPILCPDGGWFNAATERAECYFEELS